LTNERQNLVSLVGSQSKAGVIARRVTGVPKAYKALEYTANISQ
jgi:hypothetical protein